VTVIVYLCWPRPDEFRQLMHLLKITAGVIIGSILGVAVMSGLVAALAAFD